MLISLLERLSPLLEGVLYFILSLFATKKPNFERDQQAVKNQSVDVGHGIYRRTKNKDRLCTGFKGCDTLHAVFMHGVTNNGDRPCLGERKGEGEFKFLTYNQVLTRVKNFNSGLRKLGVKPKDHLGIYSKNKVEYMIAIQACNASSLVGVSLYDTFGHESIEYICNHAELGVVICSDETITKIIDIIGKLSTVTHIIQIGDISEETRRLFDNCGATDRVSLLKFNDVEDMGEKNPVEFEPPTGEDTALIMYTSGTTGVPKGVVLKHKNVTAVIGAVLGEIIAVNHDDSTLSYLPLAHILERAVEEALLGAGAKIGYFRGDFKKHVMSDLMALKPTLFASVPRVLETIYNGATEKIDSGPRLTRFLFNLAFRLKSRAIDEGLTLPLLDKVVFSKITERTGGRFRIVLSGGAYLRAELQRFMRVVFGCAVVQGYGLTETCAGGTFTDMYDVTDGNIGPPVGCLELKLAEVSEMGYSPSNDPPSGEVWLRGHNIFPGYYKNEKATREVLSEDGWFQTGDIACRNKNGTFNIIDRKKNMVKLPQGEYVALEKVENTFAKSKFVEQICVHAELDKPFLVAVVVPNRSNLTKYAQEHNIDSSSFEELCENSTIVKAVVKDLAALAKKDRLNGFEVVRNVLLTPEQFTPENELVTPSMKVKRPAIRKHFGERLLNLFDKPISATS